MIEINEITAEEIYATLPMLEEKGIETFLLKQH